MNRFLDALTAGAAAEAVGGRLSGDPSVRLSRARADSRVCGPGDLFAALPGERTDGNLYVGEAWRAGASAALASAGYRHPAPGALRALITVDDPPAALQLLAARRREESPRLRVVGVTGSSGKTTTKNILASILVHWMGDELLASEGNFNSDIGLPLTLMDLRSRHRAAVLEMGMNRAGEMALLTKLAKPEIGVITNIGSAHIGLLGSREAIAREKRSIFNGAGPSSTAIVGADEPRRDYLLEGFPGEVRLFGRWGESGWESREDLGLEGYFLHRGGRSIRFRLPGSHNLANAMAAVEAALVMGVPESSIAAGLEAAEPAFGRCDVHRGVFTVIRDYYNANPESLGAALGMLSHAARGKRKIVVLGDMLELGGETSGASRDAGRALADMNPDAVILFGDSLQSAEEVLKASGYPGVLARTVDIEAARSILAENVRPGDTVLLKGSRGSALERLDDVLNGAPADSPSGERGNAAHD